MKTISRFRIRYAALALVLALPTGVGASDTPRPGGTVLELQARRQTAAQRRAAARRAAQRRAAARRRRPPPPPPLKATSPRSVEALRTDLAHFLGARTRSGSWGVSVISLSRGDTLFESNGRMPMLPASTQKLLTSAVALERLGPEYRFSTDVLRDGELESDGTFRGNLIIRGDGDPAFSRRFHPGAYSEPVDKLARAVASNGIRRVTGYVLGDATAFDAQLYPSGWLARYRGASYAARVSPLSLNENIVWVTVAPAKIGGGARVSLEPASSVVPLRGGVRTVKGGGTAVRARYTTDGAIQVSGSIGSRSPVRRFGLVMENPSTFTTGAFHAALRRVGITVDGGIRMGETPSGATKIASVVSPPLDQLVAVMNRESINLFAELLFRNAVRGPGKEEQGSARAGQSLIRRLFAEKFGADTTSLWAADGSGLSTLDRITSHQMSQLLGYAHTAPWGPAFHQSLPVAGKSELLRRRMKFTPADGNLHAKTGTTAAVLALAGYVTSENGEVVAFSFLYNGTDRWNARSTIDAMGETIARFAR